jgi:hypothetical protein
MLVAFAFVLGLAFVPTMAGDAKGKSHTMTAEIVSVDMNAKTITVKDDKGENHTAPVLAEALEGLKTVKPGDKVTLTCLDNEKGEHQGVSGIKPAKPATAGSH